MDLQGILETEGAVSFDFAFSEEEAVRKAQAHRPDFITSDVTLATGTGPFAVAAIRQALGWIPTIFITGTPEECQPRNVADCIIVKPFAAAEVAEAYRQFQPM